jgi:hypothetical protein
MAAIDAKGNPLKKDDLVTWKPQITPEVYQIVGFTDDERVVIAAKNTTLVLNSKLLEKIILVETSQ